MATNVADLVATLRMDAGAFVTATKSADKEIRRLAESVAKSQGHFWRMNSTFDQTANYTKIARNGVSSYTEILGKRVPDSAGKAEGAISRLGVMMAATFTVAAISKVGQWGMALFNAGAQSEIMGLRYRVVFGEMTGDLDRWVQANKTAFGEAQDDMEGYLAQVANMLQPLGMTVEESANVSQQVLEMANAWSIWSGGTVSSLDAAEAMTKGLMGQTRGLIQLGMKIDDTSLEQALLTAGTANLTGEEKTLAEVQARLSLLVGRSGPAFEVAGLAMEGATGQARELQFSFATLKDTIADLTAGSGGQSILGFATGWLQFTDLMVKSLSLKSDLTSGSSEVQALVDAQFAPWMQTTPGEAAKAAARRLEWQAEIYSQWALDPQELLRQLRQNEQMFGLASARMEAAGVAAVAGVDWGRLVEQVPELMDYSTAEMGKVGGKIVDQFVDGLNNATEAGFIHKRIVAVLGEQMVNPIHQAFLEARREVDRGFDQIALGFTEFELPDISLDDFMDNLADWQDAQDNVDAMLAALGEHGLDSFASALMEGLSAEQLAYIAAVWGGDLKALYDLLPDYDPSGSKHPGAGNPSIKGEAAGGPVSAMTPYVVGERGPELFVPRSAGTIIPNGQYGSSGGSSGGGSTVNIGMVIGDDETVAETVSRALRRAKQRGG